MLNFFKRASIKRKQMLIIMFTTGIALLLACAAFATYEVITFRKALVRNLSTLAEIVGNNTSAALDFGNVDDAASTLSALKAEPDIVGACIFTRDGDVFVAYDRSGDDLDFHPPVLPVEGHAFHGQRLVLSHAIVYKGETAGYIYLESDMRALYSRLNRYAAIAAGVFVITLLIAFFISAQLQRLISEPILRLVQTAHAVARDKDYSVRVQGRSQDEIGVLINGFNEMLTQIQERDAILQSARAELELRVTERTQELANSLSLIHATLESTTDGILVLSKTGVVTTWNERFKVMWQIPQNIMGDRGQMLQLALEQMKDAARFKAKVDELNGHAEREHADVMELNDGRIFEYYSKPQQIDEKYVGRVWSFRDVTERNRAENELREKSAMLEAQTNSSIDGMLVIDNRGEVLLRNQRFIELLNVPQHLIDQKEVEAELQHVASLTRHPEKFHERIQHLTAHPDETSRDEIEFNNGMILDRYSAPVIGKDGRQYGRFMTFRDITERKKMERELAYERDLLRSLLDHSPDHIYFKDVNSRFIKCSLEQVKRFGLKKAEEIVGKTDFDFFDEEHARPAFLDEQKIVQTGVPVIGKVEKEVWKHNTDSWVLTTKMPLRDATGQIIGTFGISKDITEIKQAEARLNEAHKQLMETSRMAGMAEVATSVLHNVGNVLNSVNVSSSLVSDRVRGSKVAYLAKAVTLLQTHAGDLAGFLANDPKGRQLPGFLANLSDHLLLEQKEIVTELKSLVSNVEHIKEIVAMQQSYAKVSGVMELLPVTELVEDALRMNAGAFERHQIQLVREYSEAPPSLVDKHKVLQILINLIRNAKYALDDGAPPQKTMTIRVGGNGNGMARISVIDNGVGISSENLTRIFGLGFTTRKEGHGFGLHNGALAARELGGSLTVHSEGPGTGATFTLEFPSRTGETTL